MLYISHRENNVGVLGPGIRYVIWTQGCKRRCPGCIFPAGQAIDQNGYWMQTGDILREIADISGLTGITISGGEPFLQPKGLMELIKAIREQTTLDIMLYSGFTLEELRGRHDTYVEYILANIDLLIDGEYREELNHNTIYRGSDNQRIWFLSNKYKPFKHLMETTINRSIEFVYRENELFMIGIPANNFQQTFWKAIERREKRDSNERQEKL